MSTTTHRTPGETFAGYTDLVTMTCGGCGVMFAMPAALRKECLDHHGRTFYCPNGHPRVFVGKTEAEKLRENLEYERRRAGWLASERDQANASARAQKARATRFKNDRDRERTRVAAGVCPCCNRTFQNLARHMAGQHPDFTDPPAEYT